MATESNRRFDDLASDYDKPRTIQRAQAVAEAIRNQLDITPTMHALDFGAGTGLISLALRPYLGSIIAVDKSQGMLDELREKIESQGIDGIVPAMCDNFVEEYSGGPLDLIYSVMTMHHIPDVGAVMQAFYSLLKLGGLVAVSDLDAEDGSFHSDTTEVHHHGFNRDQMVDLFEKAGFQKIATSTAYTYTKEAANGEVRDFSMFLITAQK